LYCFFYDNNELTHRFTFPHFLANRNAVPGVMIEKSNEQGQQTGTSR
jgi:hypothetical protein